MFNLLVNANIFLLFISLVSIGFCILAVLWGKKRNKVITLVDVVRSDVYFLGVLLIFLAIYNLFFPITKVFSILLCVVLVGFSFCVFLTKRKQFVFLFPIKTFLLIVLVFNIILCYMLLPDFDLSRKVYLSRNTDVLVHETFIEKVKNVSQLNTAKYCKSPDRNLFWDQICPKALKNYPFGSHVLIAFLDNMLPLSVFLKTNYSFLVFALVLVYVLTFVKADGTILLLIPFIFHPSIHFSFARDHVSQSVLVLYYILIIGIGKSNSWNSFFLLSALAVCGIVVVYPFLLPFFLPVLTLYIVYRLRSKLFVRKIDRTFFVGSILFLSLAVLFLLLQLPLFMYILREANPGGVNSMIVGFIESMGGGFFEYQNVNVFVHYLIRFTVLLYIAFYFIDLVWSSKSLKRRFAFLGITIMSLFLYFAVKNLHVYWVYKISFAWVLTMIVTSVYVGTDSDSARKNWWSFLRLFLVIWVTAVWVYGSWTVYYKNDFRLGFSKEMDNKIEEINYVNSMVADSKKSTYLWLDLYANQIVSIFNPWARLIAEFNYVSNTGKHQYVPDRYNSFVSNFDLSKIERIIFDKKDYIHQYIPLFFVKMDSYDDIEVYDKEFTEFEALPITKQSNPFIVFSENDLRSNFDRKGNLVIKYSVKGSNKICDFVGDGDFFVNSTIDAYPVFLINAYIYKGDHIDLLGKYNSSLCVDFDGSQIREVVYTIDFGEENDFLYINNFFERSTFADGRTFRWSRVGDTSSTIKIPRVNESLNKIRFFVAPENIDQTFAFGTKNCPLLGEFKFTKQDVNIFVYETNEEFLKCIKNDSVFFVYSTNETSTSTPYQFLFDRIEFIYD